MDCKKCFKKLHTCTACNGRPNAGGRTCSKCNNTGLLCVDHDGFHGR